MARAASHSNKRAQIRLELSLESGFMHIQGAVRNKLRKICKSIHHSAWREGSMILSWRNQMHRSRVLDLQHICAAGGGQQGQHGRRSKRHAAQLRPRKLQP